MNSNDLPKFDEILRSYYEGKLSFAEAKAELVRLLSPGSLRASGSEIGFDVRTLDQEPLFKQAFSEVWGGFMSALFGTGDIFANLSPAAHTVIGMARILAGRSGSTAVGTEHLLLGLLQVDRPLFARILNNDETTDGIQTETEKYVGKLREESASSEALLSPQCLSVLEFAKKLAETRQYVETVHILAGLLQESQSLASQILAKYGLDMSQIGYGS